jgi:CheY-like chemotaxis protein
MTNGPKPQILVVDDEPSVRETLGMLLMSVGYEVAMAENGVSAVSQLNRVLPDLIVTDLNMPQMSGIELISHVRNRYPSISIVAMSGDYQGDAVPAGIIADRFYPKGQHPHNLLTTIASLIATNPARGSAHEDHTRTELDS